MSPFNNIRATTKGYVYGIRMSPFNNIRATTKGYVYGKLKRPPHRLIKQIKDLVDVPRLMIILPLLLN